MTTLKQLKEENEFKLNKLRAIKRLINTPEFQHLWEDSTCIQKQAIEWYIHKNDLAAIRSWCKNHDSLELGERSTKQLRELARLLSIPYWSRLTKPQLIYCVQEARNGH